jgi:hypothetical protein
LGLLDDAGKPTWFTDGKPDMINALKIAGPHAAAMPPEERLTAEMDLFGRRGGGGFAVLGSEKAIGRYDDLRKGLNDPGNINRYNTLLADLMGTSKMTARTTFQEYNVALIERGPKELPVDVAGVKGLSAVLGWFTGGHKTQEDKTFIPNWREQLHDWMQLGGPWGWGASQLPKKQSFEGDSPFNGALKSNINWQDPGSTGLKAPGLSPFGNMNFLQGPKLEIKPRQTAFSLNIDGRVLGQTVIEQMEDIVEHATGSPNYNALAQFPRNDGGLSVA